MSYFLWLTFAVIAIVIEIAIPTFFALFAGVGFLAAGAIAFFFPDAMLLQLISAAIFMVIGAIVFQTQRIASADLSSVGTHNEFVGILGRVIVPVTDHHEGDVELYEPVIGNRHWMALSQNIEIEAGCEIEIVEIRGNTLVVKPHTKG
jgi:inner membrane protein